MKINISNRNFKKKHKRGLQEQREKKNMNFIVQSSKKKKIPL